MVKVVAEEELYRSCHLIFGKDLKVSRDFLKYLQLSGIKKAYRQKALELHPDLSCSQSRIEQQARTAQFVNVQQAYEHLLAYLIERDRGARVQSGSRRYTGRQKNGSTPSSSKQPYSVRPRESGKAPQQDTQSAYGYRFQSAKDKAKQSSLNMPLDPETLYKGAMPKCPLLFGRYLYYSGIINLQIIGKALVWQRSQRPRLGEIGCRLGWLSRSDALRVLTQRKDNQLFGESAMSLGLLTTEQVQHMMDQQKKLHKRFGQYFVEKNYWNPATLKEFIVMHKEHNTRMQHFCA